jgi:hypothetical protein
MRIYNRELVNLVATLMATCVTAQRINVLCNRLLFEMIPNL